ncbi:MAG: zinc-binding dehydrogenase [Kineosporiaceae bacterium]
MTAAEGCTDPGITPAAATRSMTAMQVLAHGGPDALTPVRLPVPVPGPGEVLVRNAWIGVNYVDLQHRAGEAFPVPLPLVPGTEAGGVVEAVGPGVHPSLRDRRVVHLGHLAGVYAEYTAVPVEYLSVVPDDISLDVAAAVAMAGSTAHVLVRMATWVIARTIVVHGASGSVGGAVVQLAAAEGARVIGITSTRAKAAVARALGAHDVIVGGATPGPAQRAQLVAEVRRLTGTGADVVFDATGARTFEASLDMLATGGSLLLYGAITGHPRPFAPQALSGLTGSTGRSGSLGVRWVSASDYLAGPARGQVMAQVLDDVRAGRLSARVVQRFPLVEAAAAHRALARRRLTGKVLLDSE